MKRAWAVLLVTLTIVLPARFYAVFTLTDPKTGYYTDGGRLAAVWAAVAALGCVLAALFGRRRAAESRYAPLRSVPAAAFAALAAAFILGESLVSLAQDKGLSAMSVILALSGVCAAASLLMAAYDFGAGETVLRQHPLAALLVPVWGCLCLVSLFVTFGATVNRFENVYHTCTAALMLLFLFSQAKLLSGVEEKDGGKMVFGYGFAAVIVSLTDAVPNLALFFSGRAGDGSQGFLSLMAGGGATGSFPAGTYFVDLALAAYAVAWLAAESRRRTAAPMVAISPGLSGEARPESVGAAPRSDTEQASAGAVEDPLQPYLDFLQKVYPGEHKFVEKGKPECSAPQSAKS